MRYTEKSEVIQKLKHHKFRFGKVWGTDGGPGDEEAADQAWMIAKSQ